MGSELLLEIGTEEIPAGFIPPALEELAAELRKKLEHERIEVGEIISWGTPRRLSLVAKGVAEVQAEVTKEVVGPPKAVAYDADGKPTQALTGFARAQGVAVEDLAREMGISEAALKMRVMRTRKRLRKKLEEDPAHARYIFSVYGEGYRFMGGL